jgi:hypothetical protein
MAQYEDFKPQSNNPAEIYTQIATLLGGAYSVEIVPKDDTVILRVWYSEHCSISDHDNLGE